MPNLTRPSTSGLIPFLIIVSSWFVLPPPPSCAVLLLTSPVSVRPVTHASCSARYWTVRWDPNRQNMLFLNQSANLYAHYYQLQIAVHRPFIPSPRKPSSLTFPSLAICTNAARSCTHVMDVQCRRAGSPLPLNQVCLPVNPCYYWTRVTD